MTDVERAIRRSEVRIFRNRLYRTLDGPMFRLAIQRVVWDRLRELREPKKGAKK